MFNKNNNLELWKSILIWFVENDGDQFELNRNQLSSQKLNGKRIWFWSGVIKLMDDNNIKPGDMKTVTNFDSKKGILIVNETEIINLN